MAGSCCPRFPPAGGHLGPGMPPGWVLVQCWVLLPPVLAPRSLALPAAWVPQGQTPLCAPQARPVLCAQLGIAPT